MPNKAWKKTKNTKLILLKAKPLSGKIDVVGGKLLKIYEFIHGELRKYNFKAIKSDWEWDKKNDAVFYFLFERNALQKTIEVEGPPLKIKQHADNFRKIHKKTFVKSGRVFALEQREFLVPEDLLKNITKSQFVRERSKSIKIDIL